MGGFHFSLFGKFAVTYDSIAISGLNGQKVQELLSYLLLRRNRPHNRELLSTLLWDNGSSPHAKKNLRQLLWQIHSTVDELDIGSAEVLLNLDGEWIRLDTSGLLQVDVEQFEQTYLAVNGTRGAEMQPEQYLALCQAVSLYRGQLLEGWFQEWCLFERERLHEIYLAMLEKILGYCEQHLDYDGGTLYGNMILRWDPARERTHRRLMRLQYATGRRSEALRQYQSCIDALKGELDVAPSLHTVQLYQRIRSDAGLHPSSPVAVNGHGSMHAADSDLGARLDEIEYALFLVRQQLHQLRSSLGQPYTTIDGS